MSTPRTSAVVLAIVACTIVAAFAAPAPQAGPDGLAGNWKIAFADGGDQLLLWLLKLENKDGKLSGTIMPAPETPPVKLVNVALEPDTLKVTLALNTQPVRMAIRLGKGKADRLLGTLIHENTAFPVQLQRTTAKDADDFDSQTVLPVPVAKFKEYAEETKKRGEELSLFPLTEHLIAAAKTSKVSDAELKTALAPALAAAQNYGDWHKEFLAQTAQRLIASEVYAAVGEDYARQATKAFETSSAANVLRALDLLALALQKQNKREQLTALQAQISDKEIKGYEESAKASLGFDLVKPPSRKGNRVALVEQFVSCESPQSVSPHVAVEGLARTFPQSDVLLLQYHMHIPAADPLATPISKERWDFYEIRSVPYTFFNGNVPRVGGGTRQNAPQQYVDYVDALNPLLGRETPIHLHVEAKRTGDDITIKADASGYKASDRLKLRLALVEPWVRHTGGNGLSYHINVVRAMPGGSRGFGLGKDKLSETVKINLADLTKALSKQLDAHASLEGQRPFNYRNLRVVALIQNDDNREVLQAADTPVK